MNAGANNIELADTIRRVLGVTDFVLGYSAGADGAVATRFDTSSDLTEAIFDNSCAPNLSVYLPRLKDKKVGIVAKDCDIRCIIQLAAERVLDRDRLRIIRVECPGIAESPEAPQLMAKCYDCRESEPIAYDEAVGRGTDSSPLSKSEGVARREDRRAHYREMAPDERRRFWEQQFSRCIRCNACRESCPLCFCRDACVMQTGASPWTGGRIDARQSQMAQQIRITHMAGRCTGCQECERACPVGIPLMLLLDEQNRVVEQMFGYRAGMDPEATPPLLGFDVNEGDWENST